MTFATSRFLNRDRVIDELTHVVRRLKSRHPDIEAVYLFGSFASGVPTPRSDADMVIVTAKSPWEDLRTELLSVSVPVDLYLMKPDAFAKQSAAGKGIAAAAVRSGVKLL